MDKYEYKVRSDEIKALITEGDFSQAAEIADTIDWRRVKSVMMLCTVSDLYKINRRYEDAKNMLLLAYERRPGGRTICYSLCELCIKTEEFVQALNYYKEFVQAAPKDPSRFILQYKLYEAQEVSLEERISVLEELKKRDYREKWAYELAFLYHRVGLATRCVEECDEMILWFGDGKYVVKAMELKMLHQPLTPEQQQLYDHRFDAYMQPAEEQTEYVESYDDGEEQPEYIYEGDEAEQNVYQQPAEAVDPEELDIQVKTMDVGQYNTINLQAELAEGLQEVLGADEVGRTIVAPMLESEAEETLEEPEAVEERIETDSQREAEEIEETEVFFGETGEISQLPSEKVPVLRELDSSEEPEQGLEPAAGQQEEAKEEFADASKEEQQPFEGVRESAQEPEEPVLESDTVAETVMEQMRQEEILTAQPPRELAEVLSQEADGQISLVMPDAATIEKQLTGQMKIEDVLLEWERMKKANEEKRREEVRQHVLRQTGPMFTEFEEAVRDGLLEQLESGKALNGSGSKLAEELSQGAESVFEEDEPPADVEYMEEFEEEYAGEAEPAEAGEDTGDEEYAEYGDEAVATEEYADEEAYAETEYEAEEEPPADLEYIDEEEAFEGTEYEEAETLGDEEDSDAEWAEYAEAEEELSEDAEYAEVEAEELPEDAEYAEVGEEELPEYAEVGEEEFPEDAEYAETEVLPEDEEYAEAEGEMLPEDAEYVEVEAEELPEGKEYAKGKKEKHPKGAGHADPVEEIAGEPEDETLSEVTDDGEIEERRPVQREKARARGLTREEKELYAPFIQSRHSREQLVKAIDNISMAAYIGNVVVTGEEGMDTLTLAKNMIREVRMTDSNFSGKVAKISGQGLNDRNIGETLERLNNGALIIEDAAGISAGTAKKLYKSLQQERLGIIVVLEGTKKAVNKLFLENPELAGCFTARMDLEALSNDTLVSFGRLYAREMEYSIDDLGVLALHTRIEELQTIDHVVTVIEVKRIVDEAIQHASRKTLGHFFDILLAKRYDNEDMVILTEKDFVA